MLWLPLFIALLLAVGTVGAIAGDSSPASVDETIAASQANDRPTAAFTYQPSNPEPRETVVLNGSASSDSDGEIEVYRWDLDGDNQTDIEGGPVARIAFPQAGEYTVALTVVDDAGATNTTNRTIAVVGTEPPTARLEVTPTEIETGDSVTLDATGASDPDGRIVSWSIDSDGDGTFEETFESPPKLRVSFENPGEYPVKLRVTDNDGMTDTTTVPVVVQADETEGTASPTASDTDTESPGQPGFGPVVGLLGILIAVLYARYAP